MTNYDVNKHNEELVKANNLLLTRSRLGEWRLGFLAVLSNRVMRAVQGTLWRHKKRGSIYVAIGEAKLQTQHPGYDNTPVTVYISQDGQLWARPVEEFNDGRFEAL